MGARVVAFLVAVLLVIGAVVVRSRLDDSSSSVTVVTAVDPSGPTELVCPPEVETTCRDLASDDADLTVLIEASGTTADRLSTSTSIAPQAWLVPAPWAGIVREARSRAGLGDQVGDDGPVLARSPVVVVGWTSIVDALVRTCGTIGWECVAQSSRREWGELGAEPARRRVIAGHPPADSSATGLAVTASIVASRLGPRYASNDFDSGFRTWFSDFEQSMGPHAPAVGTPLDQMLFSPPSFSVVGSLEAVAAATITGSRSADDLRVSPAEPAATADLVVVSVGGADVDGVRRDLPVPLADAGWWVDGAAPPGSALTSLPDDDGLPSPGVLAALRTEWQRAAR